MSASCLSEGCQAGGPGAGLGCIYCGAQAIFPASIDLARASFLRLMIPQLSVGFPRIAASYGVELARLENRTVESVAAEFS